MKTMKLAIGISGASGAWLGVKLLSKILAIKSVECYVVASKGAKAVLQYENGLIWENLAREIKGAESTESHTDSAKSFLESNAESRTRGAESFVESRAKITDSTHFHAFPRLESCLKSLRDNAERLHIFDDDNFNSPLASGSFGIDKMIIAPCSANTLAKVACGISDTLILRSALVCLKERKALLLAVREMPFNAIMLQNMLSLANIGAIIAPPIMGYYAKLPQGTELDAMEDFIIGKWLDALGIPNALFTRWNPAKEA